MNKEQLQQGQEVTHTETGARYAVDAVEQPNGGPQQRRYVLRLLGRWLALRQPIILTSLSEDYVLSNFSTVKNQNMKKLFNIGSTGFIQAVIVFSLGLFASWGASFPKDVHVLGMEITTSLSTGGVWAIVGILVTSVAFPIYNWFKSGGRPILSFIFGKDSNVLSLIYAVMAGVQLTGFVLPEGTVESIFQAVKVQDWGTLGALVFGPVLDTFRRWLKERNNPGGEG